MSIDIESLGDAKLDLGTMSNSDAPAKKNENPWVKRALGLVGVLFLVGVVYYVGKYLMDQYNKTIPEVAPSVPETNPEDDVIESAMMKPVPGSRYAAYEEEPY